MTQKRIFAMGGGGFSMEPENPLLDEYLLSLTKKQMPSVCFIPTASGDSPEYCQRFFEAFPRTRADSSVLTTFRDPAPGTGPALHHAREHLLSRDIIYVGGGSTVNMLAVWRAHGIDRVLTEAWNNGVILAGLSAGMICWFESGVTDSLGPGLSPLRGCLGLLPGSACPHFDGEADRKPSFTSMIGSGLLPDGFAADDGAAILFDGSDPVDCVSSRRGASAYRVHRTPGTSGKGAAQTFVIPTRCLESTAVVPGEIEQIESGDSTKVEFSRPSMVEPDEWVALLRSLPEWFGIEEAITAYGEAIASNLSIVARIAGEPAGFLTFTTFGRWAAEIHVMAVSRKFQGQGIGRRLVTMAEDHLKARGVRFLQVKTLSPSRKDANYEMTRRFYLSVGFTPLEEFPTLWDEHNPCLQLVKAL